MQAGRERCLWFDDLSGGDAFAALCLHEAAHASVALALGVEVEEVSVARTLLVDAATESLYGITAGSHIPAGGTRILDEFLETHPREILAAMAAPSSIATGVETIDDYDAREAEWALSQADERSLDRADVLELARATATEQRDKIRELAPVLRRQGVWRPGDATEPAQM